jgi:hypothetical protein
MLMPTWKQCMLHETVRGDGIWMLTELRSRAGISGIRMTICACGRRVFEFMLDPCFNHSNRDLGQTCYFSF